MRYDSYEAFRQRLALFFSEKEPDRIDAALAECLGVSEETLFKTGELSHNDDGETPYFISWEFFSEGAIARFGVRHTRFRGLRVEWYMLGFKIIDAETLIYECMQYGYSKEEG